MPNYKYKCENCGISETKELSISFEPSYEFLCPNCNGGTQRRVMINAAAFKSGKKTLGKWFKEQTGKDLLGDK